MMKKFLSFFWILAIASSPSIGAMNKSHYVISRNLPNAVPNEIWEYIFLIWNESSFIEKRMPTHKRAVSRWYTMESTKKMSLVCKTFYNIARKLLLSYAQEITQYINSLGGKDYVVYNAFMSNAVCDHYWVVITRICGAMGADLNTSKNLGDETLLTRAILKKNDYQIIYLLQAGANPKHPNKKGVLPIDLAYNNGFLSGAAYIKDYGGDPNDDYEFEHMDGTPFSRKQKQVNQTNSNVNNIPVQQKSFVLYINMQNASIFAAGLIVGAAAYWYRNRSSKSVADKEKDVKVEKEDDNLDANAEGGVECHDSVEAVPEIDGTVKELVS